MASTDEDRVTGTVAMVLDDRELLLEIDEADAELAMRFAVMGRKDVPVNGRNVSLSYAKVIVKIVRLEEDGYAVGRTFRTIKGRPSMLTTESIAPGLVSLTGTPDRTETIRTGEKTFRSQLTAEDFRIGVGDHVVETLGDEYMDNDT
jgi:hypothetical protein